ncbi:uncharacterized protein M421DRAFT_202507 [Didymella exigua CBS 183.55]|uniref:Secreted protein n=1 Tax=Didymella exigua CBS 183.55 TaxID=1150837 RepID=A0A6A5S824_9PLEO|nr:uncharacterized protein M421DRAFT_202507 [Didymella exigua CBS 183.55]KAF1933677.1 hypothetical protein M421DRAFT_202507 [Didymella exigua CBS 183.55]
MIPTFTKNGLLCFSFWPPVYATPQAGSVDGFLSSMLSETMGERRWLRKRREGKFNKSHGRIACEHLRMISGSWRVSRQPGTGCIASFCLHAGVFTLEGVCDGCVRVEDVRHLGPHF